MVGANGGEEVVGEAPETGKGVIGEDSFDMSVAANRALSAREAAVGF